MAWYLVLASMIGGICFLMLIGIPVAFAFLGANIIAALFFFGGLPGIQQVLVNGLGSITIFTFVTVPLFLIMGELFFRTGLALRVFDALDILLGRLPGRLAFLTVGGGSLFSTLTGSSMANTAMLGSLLLPEMKKRGYKPYMAMGPILGTGGLAMIIPPSGLAVLLGSIAQIDIAALLIAGLIPGFVLAGLYAGMIAFQLWLDPDAAPSYEVQSHGWREKVRAVAVNILPMSFVIFAVIGSILLGLATPSEAAAFGVAAVIILAAAFRCLTWNAMFQAFRGALRVSGMIFLIIVGSSTFSQILAYSGATVGMVEFVTRTQFDPNIMLLIMFGTLLLLGTMIDATSIMMLTVPIFFPIAKAPGFDPVWFGLVLLLGIEMSGTTPPFGMLVCVMLGGAPPGTTRWQVARAA
ncbi:MAG: TRAP transporter large permease subunit, partial [Beijerinckiaceae bacterium]